VPIAFFPYQEKYLDTSWLGDRMKIQTLIANKRVYTISANDKVKHLVESLNNFHIGAMVVSLDGKVIDGIVSERDIVRAMPGKLDMMEELHVRDIMTVGVHTCTSDATVSEVMELMTKQRIRHVPVVDADGNLLSIVSIGDVVKHHVNEISVENEALKQYVSGSN
jgi:CBS domain-containing protein